MKLIPLLLAAVCHGAEPPEMPAEFTAHPQTVVEAARGATVARFPDADSVIVDDRIHTRFEPDGSDITWDDEWIKVLTEKGRRGQSSVTLDYSERYGDAGILCVEIVGTNGAVRAVDFAKTLKVATDNSSMGANIVDPLDKKVSCAVPGLQTGEIRHVRFWRRTRKARMRDAWADVNLLEQTAPILATEITVDQPAGRPLVHAVVRNAFSNTVARAADRALPGGRTLLRWTARDVPQLFREPNMPPLSQCAQTLRLSTIRDWPTVSRWYWSICERHLAKTTPAMTNTVAGLVRGCRNEDERIRAVFRFVSQEVRYMGLTLEDDAPGYEPHDVDVTFDNRYGVCRDKAALLAALLRIAGVKAFPVLIHAGAKMDAEVPNPYFNHAIVAVEIKGTASGRYLLMDPTDESTKDLCPAYLSDRSYLVARPEGEGLLTSPTASADANLLRVASEGSLDANGDALLTTTVSFGGINDTAVRHALLKKTPEERRRWFENVWRNVTAGAELLSLEVTPADLRDTETPLAAKTVVRLPEALARGRTRDALSLPFFTRALSVVNGILDENTALETRRFPLVLPCTAGTEERVRLVLGDAVGRVRSLPSAADVAAPAYAFARTVVCTNGTLTARRTMRVNDVNFAVDAYTALRNARKDVETAEREDPLFASRGAAGANVRFLRHDRVTRYVSPTAWVTTNTVEKEILTYRGKQTSSELKFTYAPCTRGIEIVAATVSNRNGRVFAVTPKEINVMDCGWAASAPRYPGSKILVVNLPGVEIGSVIRTVIAETVTNAPVAEAFAYGFGGKDPYDEESVELHVPSALDLRVRTRIPDGLPADCSHAVTVTTNAAERIYAWRFRNPPREPEEGSLPPAALWRAWFAVSLADWEAYGASLVEALDAARGSDGWWGGADHAATARETVRSLTADCATAGARITAIRKLLRKVRTTGPGLFELPFDRAFTAPDRVLAEGYGSRTDRMNLAYALLEAAGFECSWALVANDAQGFRGSEARWRAVPRPGIFGTLAIRAVWRTGRLPFLGGEETFWFADENEYTPPEASARIGDSYFDPRANAFGRVASADARRWDAREDNSCRMEVRENGAVDFDVTNRTYGAAVGGLRKTFAELLPEMRSRFHQKLLGGLAQNATATGELVTDTEGYPFAMSFRAYAEGYAVAKDDALTVRIPDFTGKVFGVGGERRTAPIGLNGRSEVVDAYEIVFPEGYTRVERLPPELTIRNPRDRNEVWLRHAVTQRMVDGRLHVTVRRCVSREHATLLDADDHPFLREWNRRAAAEDVRTISIRRR